jgi:hypothetical protein
MAALAATTAAAALVGIGKRTARPSLKRLRALCVRRPRSRAQDDSGVPRGVGRSRSRGGQPRRSHQGVSSLHRPNRMSSTGVGASPCDRVLQHRAQRLHSRQAGHGRGSRSSPQAVTGRLPPLAPARDEHGLEGRLGTWADAPITTKAVVPPPRAGRAAQVSAVSWEEVPRLCCQRWIARADVARRRRCRATTPGAHRATRGCATPAANRVAIQSRPSRSSSRSPSRLRLPSENDAPAMRHARRNPQLTVTQTGQGTPPLSSSVSAQITHTNALTSRNAATYRLTPSLRRARSRHLRFRRPGPGGRPSYALAPTEMPCRNERGGAEMLGSSLRPLTIGSTSAGFLRSSSRRAA